jgi:hypothetical protein
VTIFARDVSDNLARLVKKIDETVGKNEGKKMASFLVVLAEDADKVAPKLETLAQQQNIKNVPLTVFDGEAGPESYKISKDADVTVLLWTDQNVKVNHAFKAGDLNDKAIEQVVADTAKILK